MFPSFSYNLITYTDEASIFINTTMLTIVDWSHILLSLQSSNVGELKTAEDMEIYECKDIVNCELSRVCIFSFYENYRKCDISSMFMISFLQNL